MPYFSAILRADGGVGVVEGGQAVHEDGAVGLALAMAAGVDLVGLQELDALGPQTSSGSPMETQMSV